MTSLTRPEPESSRTSSERTFARGSAPVNPLFPPAARPATSVPWPKPSPFALAEVPEVKSICLVRRGPKSLRPWTPESTTAIVGYTAPFGGRPHCGLTAPTQLWGLPYAVERTSESSVIETTLSDDARASSWSPVTSAVTVGSSLNFFSTPLALPGCLSRTVSTAVPIASTLLGSLVWMITRNV